MNRKMKYYTAGQKMSELISADSRLLTLLERLGIKLGFGESTVGDICRRYGLSTELFLTICNIYSFDGYLPSTDNLTADDLVGIVAYLRASHRYYTERYFPVLHANIHSLVESLDGDSRAVLDRFYDDYDAELNRHFAYEDSVVFPYVDALLSRAPRPDNYSIDEFARSHSDIDVKLNDLKNIIIKYLPEDCPSQVRNTVLLGIFDIEEDLSKHTVIEDRLLVPLVTQIEQAYE